MPKALKYVYTWGNKKADGDGSMKALLGGKGANLAEMTRIGLPVPPGFTISTDVCTYFYANKRSYPKELQSQMEAGVANMEKIMGTKFGAPAGMPLLVAVRSGARDSMPGMMDTILNLGLNDESVAGLANATGNERFAYDAYRRLINMFGDVVCGVDHAYFEVAFDKIKTKYSAAQDNDVPLEGMIALCDAYKKVFRKHYGAPFPQDPLKQLELAVEAVFSSWMQSRAVRYRRLHQRGGRCQRRRRLLPLWRHHDLDGLAAG